MIETLTELIACAIGVPEDGIHIRLRQPIDHQSNRLYDVWASGQHLIAKEFLKPDEFATAPAREYRSLELLAPLDIVPLPLFIERAPAPPLGPLVGYEFIEGEMWDRRRPTAARLGQLAETWLKMHRVSTGHLWFSTGHEQTAVEMEGRLRRHLEVYEEWANAEFLPGRRGLELCLELVERGRRVAEELGDHEPVLCFCRADPRFANVIQRPDGRIAMVDWEDSGLRDPAKDLADLVTHPNQEDLLSPDDWHAFLGPYLAEGGKLDLQLERRMQLYLALFPIFWLAELLQSGVRRAHTGQLSGWMINGLPAKERLRRYLARGLAWPAREFSARYDSLSDLEFFPSQSSSDPGRD